MSDLKQVGFYLEFTVCFIVRCSYGNGRATFFIFLQYLRNSIYKIRSEA